jgi:hypothetical protein
VGVASGPGHATNRAGGKGSGAGSSADQEEGIMAKLTMEEKCANRLRRQEERAARDILLPEAEISRRCTNAGCIIECVSGVHPLVVRKRGQWSRTADSDEWEEMMLFISDDLHGLALFIKALIARYNCVVFNINEASAGAAQLDTLKDISNNV